MYLSIGTHICDIILNHRITIQALYGSAHCAEYCIHALQLFVCGWVKGGLPGQVSFTPLAHYCCYYYPYGFCCSVPNYCLYIQILKSAENRSSEFLGVFFYLLHNGYRVRRIISANPCTTIILKTCTYVYIILL